MWSWQAINRLLPSNRTIIKAVIISQANFSTSRWEDPLAWPWEVVWFRHQVVEQLCDSPLVLGNRSRTTGRTSKAKSSRLALHRPVKETTLPYTSITTVAIRPSMHTARTSPRPNNRIRTSSFISRIIKIVATTRMAASWLNIHPHPQVYSPNSSSNSSRTISSIIRALPPSRPRQPNWPWVSWRGRGIVSL